MGLFLLVRWSYFFLIMMLVSAAADLYGSLGA